MKAGPVADHLEHFIPIRRAELIRALTEDEALSPSEADRFGLLCELLSATFHFEFHARLEALKDDYAPFDPDADTQPSSDLPPAEQDQRLARLFTEFEDLLERGNFVRLSEQQIKDALTAASQWGVQLEVDFGVFDRLEVFARGERTLTRTLRNWKTFFKPREIEVPVYGRLVVIFRLLPGRDHAAGDPRHAYIKIFKNIPKADLEMLLPSTRVKMSGFDRGRIFLPAVSGAAVTVYKAVKGALALAVGGIYGVLGFLGIVGGTIGYAVKSFLGYQRAKDKYQLNLTRSLYYQNLDNNAGVLFRLLDEAEEQEVREAALAYWLLWQSPTTGGWTQGEIDEAAEHYLKRRFGIDVDFEIDDALDKLLRHGLVTRLPGNRYQAFPIEESLVRLDTAWDNFFPYNTGAAKAA